jgi:Mrp family chromosome partitioning ATPase/capsular polysaccharide biosynthesis protein
MEPIDYVRALIRRWPIIAVCALIGALFAYMGTDPEPEPIRTTYRATHTLLSSANQFGSQTQVGTITFAQVPVFATTGEVPRLAAESLGYSGAPAALSSEVVVTGDPTTGTVTFSTEQENPDDAVRIADAFADETVRYLSLRQEELRQDRLTHALEDVGRLETEIRGLEDEISRQIAEQSVGLAPGDPRPQGDSITRARRDTAVREYNTAYESYRSLSEDDGSSDLNLTTLERAQPVAISTGGFTAPRTRATRVPIAAAIGALFGCAIALLAERLDSKIRDRRRAEEFFGASVIAELPSLTRRQRAARLVVAPDQHSGIAETFRSLRTSLTFMTLGGKPSVDDRVGVILITSPGQAEGKTTTAVNLAAAFAETGRRVVLVNADFRRPVASGVLVETRPPLPATLNAIERLDAEAWLTTTNVPGVDLLDLSPLGATPGDLTRATYRLAAALRDRVEVIVIDTPPLSVTTEALEFVPLADVVVLMGRVGRTPTAAAQRAGELVRFSGAERIAIALADSRSGRRRRVAYYDYYGGGRRRRKHVDGPVIVEDDEIDDEIDVEDGGEAQGEERDDGDPTTEHDADQWAEIDRLIAPPTGPRTSARRPE